MKLFNFISAACTLAMSAFVFSCTPPASQDENTAESLKDLNFTLSVKSVGTDYAEVKVAHDGERNDTWYGFVTTENDLDAAIDAKVDELLEGGKITGLKKTTTTTVELSGLEADTDYEYVVFGLTSDGTVYGKPSSVSFTTLSLPEGVTYKVNPAWTVKYNGAGVIDGETYEHTVTVTSTDNNSYLITAYPREDYEQYGIQALAEYEVEFWNSFLADYNKNNGTNLDLSVLLCKGTYTDAFSMDAGDWYAFAIGIGSDLKPNGLYAISDVITIQEGEMSAEYKAWIGDWVFTGSNGMKQYVNFSKLKADESYIMTGYEGADAEGLEVEVMWDAQNQAWAIYNQIIGTYNFGSSGSGEVWFLGADSQGSFYAEEGVPICAGGIFDNGTLGAVGYSEEWEENGTKQSYVVSEMNFVVNLSNQWYYITETYKDLENGYPTFPITITPATKSPAQAKAMKRARTMSSASDSVKEYKVFGQLK
jgi:hypothetical protein